MAINRLNIRFCTLLHNSITYDITVGVTDLCELDSILQEWALANIGEEFDLPQDLLENKAINEIVTSLDIDNFAYIQSPVSKYMDMARSAGIVGSSFPTLPTSLSSGLYLMPSCSVYLYSEAAYQGYFGEYVVDAASLAIVTGINYVGVTFNAGVPIYQSYTDYSVFNNSSIIPLVTVLYFNGSIFNIPFGATGDGLAEKIQNQMVKSKKFEIENTYIMSMTSGLYVLLSSLIVDTGISSVICASVNTQNVNNNMVLFYKDASQEWQNLSVTQVNNLQYQSGAGLASLGSGKFVVNTIFRVVDKTNVLLFNVLSDSFDSAQAALNSAIPDDIPDTIKSSAVLAGRIIIEQGATTALVQRVQKISFGV